jgi:hypothetical protein
MKLQELAVISPTKQAAKVFESYFGNSVPFEQLSHNQARKMLTRVRGLIREHRSQPAFHTSEQNPSYLKLVILEQGLSSKLQEVEAPMTSAATVAPNTANMGMQIAQKRKGIDDQIKSLQQQIQQLQQQKNNPALGMAESQRRGKYRTLSESEIQQAQVVLAAQDMVDQVQKMSEQVSAMQFKDLPALVDQIKNEVGVDQAMQFNTDATSALAGLLQNLQGARQQLDQALGVVTGQSAVVPGEVAPAGELDAGAELDSEVPPLDGEEEIDVDLDLEEPVGGAKDVDLGRTRR